MSTQENSLASFNLRLNFVVLEKFTSEEDCSEYMWDAFNVSFCMKLLNIMLCPDNNSIDIKFLRTPFGLA